MSEPIRSASASPFAAALPQVHSRRVSLRVGAFGLTYSTDRLLWDASPATHPPTADPPPVDPAPAIESERPENRAEAGSSPLDRDAARRLGLWAAAQEQAARQLTPEGRAAGQVAGQDPGGGQVAAAQEQGQASGASPVAESQAKPDPAQGNTAQGNTAEADGAAVQAGQARGGRALAQALRRATRAYQACASGFACARPMLQAVA
jgi:hypothetical protein